MIPLNAGFTFLPQNAKIDGKPLPFISNEASFVFAYALVISGLGNAGVSARRLVQGISPVHGVTE